MSKILPEPPKSFAGEIGKTSRTSRPAKPEIKYPPKGAPNVVVVLLDDVGFGSASTFGGPVPTPTLDALAQEGLRYNQFHTTALCSPTRAALLTGRNHHRVHVGTVCEAATGFPGYDSVIPKSAATLGEVLRQNGYNTSWFGKNHVTPMWELSTGGPFERWPTGLGFERFYGFHGGQTSQWEPALYDQTQPIEPHREKEDYHLNVDLADQAISWVRAQKSAAPGKPFFMHFAPGSCHAPHQAPQEWIDRFKGQFDQGWDELRQRIYKRQLELGVVPPGTRLTPRPDVIPAWEDYPERYRPVAARLMEAFAGMLAHTDDQVGRLVDAIKELGEWENTLFVYIVGDNGASGEGSVHGAWNEISGFNGGEDPEWLLEHIDDIGTKRCENHYNVGWAWALDAPFQWMKQIASHFGGTRNATVVSWPKGIKEKGGLRSQFHHVIDIFPTVLEAAGIEIPEVVNGVDQEPLDGVSMLYSFNEKEKPSQHQTQYFEMVGNRAIYHDGWVAGSFNGRLPWEAGKIRLPGEDDEGKWELYHVSQDFSQSENLAEKFPEKLEELKALFDKEARGNNVYPLTDGLGGDMLVPRPSLTEGRTHFTFYRDSIRLNEFSTVDMKNRSFSITAHLDIPSAGAEGVIICQGGVVGGWTFYVENNRPVYFYNWQGHEHFRIASEQPLPAGPVELKLLFEYDGPGLGLGGSARIFVNGDEVAEGRVGRTEALLFSISGEGLDVGQDTLSPVGPYENGFPFSGEIHKVEVDLLSSLSPEQLLIWLKGQAELVGQAE